MIAIPFSVSIKKSTVQRLNSVFEGTNDSPDAHGKRVDVLIELIDKRYSLYDHVVDSVDIELDFRS